MLFHPHGVSVCWAALVIGLGLSLSIKGSGFELSETPSEHLSIHWDGRLLGKYQLAYDASSKERLHDTYKPFLQLLDPITGQAITKGAGGQFTHHRGIFLGWNKVKTGKSSYDFWHMVRCAQIHQFFTQAQVSAGQASFQSRIHWVPDNQKPVLTEERTMTFHRPQDTDMSHVIDVHTELTARVDLELDGDPEHAGFQFRPANEVQAKETRYLFPKEGQNPRKDKDLPWVAEQFTLQGRSYTVLHLNHPSNPSPTQYSAYRDYGRFGAFFRHSLEKDCTLELNYRIVILPGPLRERERLQVIYEEWIHP